MQEDQANTKANVVPVRIEEEMRSSYMDYAMSVIIGRALPDVRDGLKPVHRRILYAMYEQSNTYNRAYKKSARIVGDVIGKYHPHGDGAAYDALVRMAQDFSMRVPLVDGQGNFGSVDGDPPAAMRYTEVRMMRVTGELLADIEKETVDFGPNYDGSESEPLVLPTRIPNLLVNGSEGIAVGMATKIPPHNLGEVINAVMLVIDKPEATLDDLLEVLPGPDFPTAALMYGTDGIRQAYETGRGTVRIRAKAHIETNESNGKDSIIVTELPFQVNKARLLEKIAQLVREKSVEGITDLRDESDRKGMRMVIELRRDVNADVMLNQLYRRTQLEISFGMNMLAIVSGQPRVLPLREILDYFVDFRRDVVTRRTLFERRKAMERLHILEGLRKALDMIDEVIKTIRASADAQEAREGLMALLEIDATQAQAILDMRLQRLTNLEINKLLDEIGELEARIARLNEILSDEGELLGVIRRELQQVYDSYADERRTELLPISGELTMEDLIANEDEVVTLTHAGYIKRTNLNEYRLQGRGGKGLKGMSTKDGDFVEDVWVTQTHTSLLIFTTLGKAHKLKVYELPSGSRATRGKPIINLIPVTEGEKVAAVLPFNDFETGTYVVTASRGGRIKKTELVAYKNIHRGGINGVALRDGDELITARLCQQDEYLLLAAASGMSIRFSEGDVRPTGRNTSGVIGMRFREDDYLVGMVVVNEEEVVEAEMITEESGGKDSPFTTLLTVTENGYGKRTFLHEYRPQNRGGLGIIAIQTSDRNGPLTAIRKVESDNELIMITDGGKIIRTRVSDISVLGRNTQGVRVIALGDDERVQGVALFSSEEDEEDADEMVEGDELTEGGEAADGSEAAPVSDVTDAAEGGEEAADTEDSDENDQ